MMAWVAIGVGTGSGIGAAVDASAKNQVEEGYIMVVALGFLGEFLGRVSAVTRIFSLSLSSIVRHSHGSTIVLVGNSQPQDL
jgi:hypothetical protein